MRVEPFYYLQLGLTALSVVITMCIVGLIMVIAFSLQFARSLPRMMVWSSMLGIVFTFTGLYLSYTLE